MYLFYSNSLDSSNILLNEEETRHCTKVLRKTVGDTIHIIDGNGNLYFTRIISISKKNSIAEILETKENFGCHSYFVRICIAPTKNIDRFEFFVEKAVEIGVNEIVPICCKNSERKNINMERTERIIVAAIKQSYKAKKPTLSLMKPVQEVLETPFDGICSIAHCDNADNRKYLHEVYKKNNPITILIGPEGDFSSSEIALAKKHNWTTISLGESRLRTETAGIAAVHTIHQLQLLNF